jgi:hypothetical protein
LPEIAKEGVVERKRRPVAALENLLKRVEEKAAKAREG